MPDEETDEEYQARLDREHNEKIRGFTKFSPETVEKIREQERQQDEDERRRLFGDDEPAVWIDRYIDP
ncbi:MULTISPECIES: hypothetical protein [Frankia]|uniref:Uncharacterized protein n=1 Tax=Frankia alni (strain DSM 45986 / CECT 9034 / ACN14a) TaxID=326424 RepID=Q0RHL2_FRAAA|nr:MULTISPECIES: hypothetical protein [Frankia]CAJ63014.1 hypothetical protein FRAAL4372 [Frankia alni ACN14a]